MMVAAQSRHIHNKRESGSALVLTDRWATGKVSIKVD
jgi:hypothetical protein